MIYHVTHPYFLASQTPFKSGNSSTKPDRWRKEAGGGGGGERREREGYKGEEGSRVRVREREKRGRREREVPGSASSKFSLL